MDISMKSRKAGMEEGIMPIKYFQAGWRRETFQTLSYVKLFMATMKMKNNFCDGYQHEVQKSWDGGGNNACKIIMCRVKEKIIIWKHKTCLELFLATMKNKQFNELSKK